MLRQSSVQGQILTERPDDLSNPLQQSPLQAPDELLTPAVVNMHVEERQGRKMSWIMDDLNRDIAKLRVIFVERLTEPDKTVDTWKSKAMPDKSYEILKILSSISDWLADANIDGESYTLPITEEEMKSAHDKPIGRRQFIEEQAMKLQSLLEESLEKTRKLMKFIVSRPGIMDKFADYLGGKTVHRPPPPDTKSAPSSLMGTLHKAGLGNNPEVERAVAELDELIQAQNHAIEELKKQLNMSKLESASSSSLHLGGVIKVAMAFVSEMEQAIKEQQLESNSENILLGELNEFMKKISGLLKTPGSVIMTKNKPEVEKTENIKRHNTEYFESGKPKVKRGKDAKRE